MKDLSSENQQYFERLCSSMKAAEEIHRKNPDLELSDLIRCIMKRHETPEEKWGAGLRRRVLGNV